MEKNYVSGQMISISNPSDLVLNVDDFLRLSKKNPSPVESLQQKEEELLLQLLLNNVCYFSSSFFSI
jgi:hypothetical protein